MKTRYVLLVIAAISILIYANALNNAFQYDDQIYIEENTNIKTIGLPDIFLKPSALFAPNTTSGHYRPLVLISYVFNYRIHGLSPAGYHILNLAFHIGSALLVFLIVKAMLPATSFTALTAALVFAVHPFNSEVVNYITARSSVMSGFFILLAFYFWVKYRKVAGSRRNETESGRSTGFKDLPATRYLLPATFYVVSLIAFLLSMLSKESAITLPVILWLYDCYFRTPHSVFRISQFLSYRTWLPYLPFVLVVVVPALYIRLLYWGGMIPPIKNPVLVQFYTGLPVLVKHIRLFFFPVGLNIDHQTEIYKTFFAWPVVGSVLFVAVYLFLAVLAARSKVKEWRVLSFFMIWFVIVLLPIIIIPLNAIFQENRGYLAIIVFAVFAGVMLGRLDKITLPVRVFIKYAASIVLIVLVSLYSAGTVYRNEVWQDGIRLWSDASVKSPESSRAHTNLGTAYAEQGRNDKATESLLKALRFSNPERKMELANIHYNLGAVYQQMGRNDMAADEYRQVTKLSPADFRPYYNLGVLYQQSGEDEAALEAYKDALKRHPSDFRSYHNMGLLYQNRGELLLAAGYYRKALSINPGYSKSRINLEAIHGQ